MLPTRTIIVNNQVAALPTANYHVKFDYFPVTILKPLKLRHL